MNAKKLTIRMSPVKSSSQVSAIGYDAASKTLAVTFKSGGTYHYHDVPSDKYVGLQKAESAGKYLGQHIKPYYKFTRIEA